MFRWGYYDIWDFVNFIFFQIALVFLYCLAKRFLRPWMAFFVVVLFNTQPLIFGHAFINPKDIPFLTFFLASVTLGLYMVDLLLNTDQDGDFPNDFPLFSLLVATSVGLFVITFVGKDLFSSFIGGLISTLYDAPTGLAFWKNIFTARWYASFACGELHNQSRFCASRVIYALSLFSCDHCEKALSQPLAMEEFESLAIPRFDIGD